MHTTSVVRVVNREHPFHQKIRLTLHNTKVNEPLLLITTKAGSRARLTEEKDCTQGNRVEM